MFPSLKMKSGNSLMAQEWDGIASNTSHALESGRILLVEDDPGNLLVASTLLETFGYRFDVAGDGCDAVEKAGTRFYPVIIMDMRMPDIDGIEATRLIRENEGKLGRRRAMILCVTADAMTGENERCLAAGMDDYLSKPYRPQELQDKLGILFQRTGENS